MHPSIHSLDLVRLEDINRQRIDADVLKSAEEIVHEHEHGQEREIRSWVGCEGQHDEGQDHSHLSDQDQVDVGPSPGR